MSQEKHDEKEFMSDFRRDVVVIVIVAVIGMIVLGVAGWMIGEVLRIYTS